MIRLIRDLAVGLVLAAIVLTVALAYGAVRFAYAVREGYRS